MIVPSIDLMNGRAVQLIGGKEQALDAGDPFPIAERFALAGPIAVVDLDAALGQGDNTEIIRELCRRYPCRVGGGIRDAERAIRWLDDGADCVVLGTAATPEVLSRLPRERVVAALDAVHGEVVVDGWRSRTGAGVLERLAELRELAGGFLVTCVEREGRMQGFDRELTGKLVDAAGDSRLTVAGGITTAADIAELDALGVDAQVGMALYRGKLPLADGLVAPMRSDRPDGLWPTVVVDERGEALGLCWSDAESVRAAVETRRGVYRSRSRGLWVKGETSGARQELLRVDLDCDRDALRFTVRQLGAGFCHRDTRSCWGETGGLSALLRRLDDRGTRAPAGSYTARLLDDPQLLRAKLIEEAGELADAEDTRHVAAEAADLMYFAAVALTRAGVPLAQVEAELDRRARRQTRRPGNAKPANTRTTPGEQTS